MTESTTGNAAAPGDDAGGMITRSDAGTPLLSCRDLTKTFSVAGGSITAVDSVSLDFPASSVLAVVGESGSGKSTLARMLLRLMPATSGTITFRDQDVTKITGQELRSYWSEVQAVFQDPFASFNQFFTVGSLLRRSLKLAGVEKEEGDHLIEECLGYVGLTPKEALHKFPHQMSGGQRQRVMVARALAGEQEQAVLEVHDGDEAVEISPPSVRLRLEVDEGEQPPSLTALMEDGVPITVARTVGGLDGTVRLTATWDGGEGVVAAC